MDKRTKLLFCLAASYMLLSMMAMVIESRKRKNGAKRKRITNVLIGERGPGYLNMTLGHCCETVATGKFARLSNEPLGSEVGETEGGGEDVNGAAAIPDDSGATSWATKPKRARTTESEEDVLIRAIESVGAKLASAIEKAGTSDKDVPEDWFDNLKNIPGFDEKHISFYYAYLVDNPHIARVFNKLPYNHKLIWITRFISEKFPGH